MKEWMRCIFFALALGAAAHASAELVFYDGNDFRGRSFVVRDSVADFFNYGFNDRASSATVRGGAWQVCSDANFRGRCVTLTPGDYPSLAAVGMQDRISSARPTGPTQAAGAPRARIVLYEGNAFGGRGVTVEGEVVNFEQIGFNDRASSAIVDEGTWQLCEHAEFRGSCVTLEPGRYPDLGGLGGRVSSARLLPAPAAGGPPPARAASGARAILFGQRGFQGRSLVIDRPTVRNLEDYNFNDRASSLRVESGYWMFCSDANFEGECRTFGPGDYATLPPDLQNRISSARRISNEYPYREPPNWRGY